MKSSKLINPEGAAWKQLPEDNQLCGTPKARPTQCEVCGQYGHVEEHHITERSRGGNDDDIIYLCRWHHSEIHQSGELIVNGIRRVGEELDKWLYSLRSKRGSMF
jgi:hypothetical protein